MAKQIYLGMEVKKKGKGLFVDCGLLIDAGSRKEAQKILEEYGEMKPSIVLTGKEAQEMLEKLKILIKPKIFGKKQERLLRKKLTEIEKNCGKMPCDATEGRKSIAKHNVTL